jgi:RNA polymerase sigma factor (sigma-70 family)
MLGMRISVQEYAAAFAELIVKISVNALVTLTRWMNDAFMAFPFVVSYRSSCECKFHSSLPVMLVWRASGRVQLGSQRIKSPVRSGSGTVWVAAFASGPLRWPAASSARTACCSAGSKIGAIAKKSGSGVPGRPVLALYSLKSASETVAHVMAGSNRGFVEKLFAEHRRALQAYFYRRIRTKSDAPDLAQEVYVRMLRVSDVEAIRNPQLYLYTVASNLVKEHAVLERRQAGRLDLDETSVEQRLGELPPLDSQLEGSQLIQRLGAALEQLPARWRTALILKFRYGLTYQEIADRLGVSSTMVKKYLAQGLGHCRHRMAQWE